MRRPSASASSSEAPSAAAVDYALCLAKTHQVRGQGGASECRPGRTVLDHCSIVACVAEELVSRLPLSVQSLYPPGSALVAGAHDIGKVSPYFYEKIRRASLPGSGHLPAFSHLAPQLESQWGGHAGVSQATLTSLQAPRFIPEIVGQHHGFEPPLAGRRSDCEVFGGANWQSQREALVSDLKQRTQLEWPQGITPQQAKAIAGLTTVADWIGSGEFFEDPSAQWNKETIAAAVTKAGFEPPIYQRGKAFAQVFGDASASFSPRPAQQALIDAVTGPGAYVLEAPMGLGKTEAALYAAYKMLELGQASGIYFALPTQVTSNKIYERFNAFLEAILAPECKHRSLLLHGGAWLVDTEMGEEGRPGGEWFSSAKRGLLAPFAVGTIDQALMAAMHVKHGFVRAFGLAGKVVILDEVHTYDAYTGTILDSLVQLLVELKCTVIILSATLNQERRRELLQSPPLSSGAYPLVTAVRESTAKEIAIDPGELANVSVRVLANAGGEAQARQEALHRVAQGQQVLWVANTVNEAQGVYKELAPLVKAMGGEAGLLHSRFTPLHRQRLEDYWVNVFGKAGRELRGKCGRLLVGTQVLEQSLDLDADFLVSQMAPTDMLLQRIGRLWRHADTHRPQGARRELWILGSALEAALASPQQGFGNSAFVYSPYVLCRSLEVWQPLTSVTIPADVRPLIEATYQSRSESGQWQKWLDELEKGCPARRQVGRQALRGLARVTLSSSGVTQPEEKAQTRYSDQETVDVLLVSDIAASAGARLGRIQLAGPNGQEIVDLPWDRPNLTKAQLRERAVKLMGHVVRVSPHNAPRPQSVETLKQYGLHQCFYLGEDGEAKLRVAIVADNGDLLGIDGRPALEKYAAKYTRDAGYQVCK